VAFTFPPLIPEERSYSAGRFNADRRSDLSGAAVRFLRSRVATGHRLTLSFAEAAGAEVRAILDHYRQAQSSFLPFSLSDATWCGTDHAIDLSWRYAEAPQVTDVAFDRYSLQVTLLSITVELPARSLTPIETGATTAVQAETPPAPPADPPGTFFRAYDPTLFVSVFSLLQVTARAFRDTESTLEIFVEPGFGRFPFFEHTGATIQVTAPNGGLSLPGQQGFDLLYDQNLEYVVEFAAVFPFNEEVGTPTYFDNPNPILNHFVFGTPTIDVDVPISMTAGSGTPTYLDTPDPNFTHEVFGASVQAIGFAMPMTQGTGTPLYTDNPDPLSTHLVFGTPTVSMGALSAVDSSTAGTPVFTDLTP
jgi:hypothetical protein